MDGVRARVPALSLMQVLCERLGSYSLTPREEEIARLLLEGLTNKEIAARCRITELTVKDHLKRVYGKMGVHQRSALISTLLKFPPARIAKTQRSAEKLI